MRLDNAVVVDFLTSTAGALHEQQLIEGKETDNLRLSISGLTASKHRLDLPLLLILHQQKSDFLSILEARYGTVGYCLNLLRYSMRPALAETLRLLCEFGAALISRAELLFNRPFLLAREGGGERYAPYSAVLIDFSESLRSIAESIADALDELHVMNGHSMAGERENDAIADFSVAQALGFTRVIRSTRAGRQEISIKRKIALALEDLAAEVTLLAEQLAANAGSRETYSVAVGCDALRAECVRLSHLELPMTEGITAWEIRRRGILDGLTCVNEAVSAVTSNTLALIGQDVTPKVTHLPESACRRVAFDLVTSGISPARAWEASHAFFSYLDRQALLPSQILVGELGRIHSLLSTKSLETVVALEKDQSLMIQAAYEKSNTLNRAQKLTEAFARMGMMFFCFLIGCGLKTQPISDVLEARPDIPFRATQQSPLSIKDASHGR